MKPARIVRVFETVERREQSNHLCCAAWPAEWLGTSARPAASSGAFRRKSWKRLCLGFLLLFSASSDGFATTFIVVNTNQTGAGSLRQAILDATATAGTNTANNSDFELTTVLSADDPVFSVFRITQITFTPGVGALIEWSSLTGKTYRVQYKNSIGEPWNDLPGDVTVTGNTSSKLDNTMASLTQGYYRVALMPGPQANTPR